MSEQLKPCPFCGGDAVHNDGGNSVYGRFWWAVWCNECQFEMRDQEVWSSVEIGMLDKSHPAKECFARWNTRAAPKVKQLVWVGDESYCYVYAETMIGTYEVVVSDTLERPHDYVWSASVELCNPKTTFSIKTPPQSDLEAAKAAAQADYERRILEALE